MSKVLQEQLRKPYIQQGYPTTKQGSQRREPQCSDEGSPRAHSRESAGRDWQFTNFPFKLSSCSKKVRRETLAGLPGPPSSKRVGRSLPGAEAPPGLRLTGTSCPAGCSHGNEVRLAISPSFKRATCLKEAQHAALFLLTFQIYSMERRQAELLTAGEADPSCVSHVTVQVSVPCWS